MIRINLAKKRKAGGGGGGLKGFDLSGLFEKLKGGGGGGGEGGKKFDINGPVPKLIMAAVACYFVDDTLQGYRAEELKKVEADVATVEKEKTAVLAKLAKIKGFEPVKKQLEDDEKQVRVKLDVVNKLLENRNAPAKIMMQLAQSIPEEVWLTDLKVTDRDVKLSGATPGQNQVSDFINNLKSTSQFGDISLKGIQETTTVSKDVKLQSFDLIALRRQQP